MKSRQDKDKWSDISDSNMSLPCCHTNSQIKIPSTVEVAEPSAPYLILNEKTRRRMCPKISKNLDDTLLSVGEPLRNRWLIKGLIGSGGYGQIYFAHDQRSKENVAIKAEPTRRRGRVVRRMILEQKVLVRLQGQPHAPIIFGSGCEKQVNFIVMQLLSTNLGDLRKQCPLKRLSKSTAGRVMMQAIAALRDLHNIGYIHRDIKPANICFGITEQSRQRLLLVDFGLVRRFRNTDGQLRPRRDRTGFRGTLRYVSIRVHKREEQGPSDDLMALYFSLLEIIRGDLPWKDLQRQAHIKMAKEHLANDDFLKISEGFGEALREFGKAVYAMEVDDTPNYSALQEIMKEFSGNVPMTDPYDWESEYVEVVNEEYINRMLKLIF
ncbi:unnamed protein product [Bursaphelenchus xylophilus]|uniref:non-specific serine/threonine protein kinase n=1 Tax=Bursaphelenchus xylophilus TaxID=6326 RepID=A0A1I7RNQ1_BURXY|nr:unnamed protein product [Bursaphelenchus xylophilus]CAG9124214.1 unnamed protein product [Bursaphelenchus xylophilus]